MTGVAAGAAVATGVFVETSAEFAGALTAEEPEGAGAVETSRVFAVLGSCVGSEGAAAGAGVGGGGGPGLNATLAMSDLFITKGVWSIVEPRLVRKCIAYDTSAWLRRTPLFIRAAT